MSHPTARKLLEWIATSFPSDVTLLRGPASPEAIALVIAATGHSLPEALKDLWQAHDGQHENPHRAVSYPSVFDSFYWHSIDQALREAETMKGVLADVRREFVNVEPWRDEWLPFASDSGGGMLVVDLVKGDVFEYQSDGDRREATWGATFDDFVDKYIARFTSGELRVDPVEGVVDTRPVAPAVREIPARAESAKLVLASVFVVLLLIALSLLWIDLEHRR